MGGLNYLNIVENFSSKPLNYDTRHSKSLYNWCLNLDSGLITTYAGVKRNGNRLTLTVL